MGGREGKLGTLVTLNKYTQRVLISKLNNYGFLDANISKKHGKGRTKQSIQEIRDPKEVK